MRVFPLSLSLWMEDGVREISSPYNAKSGVAVVIGQATRKLLHIGVRNKYCTACIPQENHVCFKNWKDSSCQMEPDIILDGFQQAESSWGMIHGVYW